MEGVERYKVRLLMHNPAWAAEFHRVRETIRRAWGENVLAVEHVGSTAVPSIPAKPVLDAAVKLKSLDRMDAVALVRLGYEFCGEQGGGERRVLFVLRGEQQVSLQHIHCYEAGGTGFDRQVGFRDYLIAHPEEARAYAGLKERLAAQYADDRAAYTKGKEAFIREIHRKMDEEMPNR